MPRAITRLIERKLMGKAFQIQHIPIIITHHLTLRRALTPLIILPSHHHTHCLGKITVSRSFITPDLGEETSPLRTSLAPNTIMSWLHTSGILTQCSGEPPNYDDLPSEQLPPPFLDICSPNPYALNPGGCVICHRKDGLFRCPDCETSFYCSTEHQSMDQESHGPPCRAIKQHVLIVRREEAKYKRQPNGQPTIQNSQIWYVTGMREIYLVRWGLISAQLRYLGGVGCSVDLVRSALERLSAIDVKKANTWEGLRSMLTPLHLRLGEDQAAYERIRRAPEYRKFMLAGKPDILEPIHHFLQLSSHIHDIVPLTLIKMRLLFALRATQNTNRAFRGWILPQEIIDLIRLHVDDTTLQRRPDLLVGSLEKTSSHIKTVKQQVKHLHDSLYTSTKKSSRNKFVWRFLLAGRKDAETNTANYEETTEARSALSDNGPSWLETPGAIGQLKTLERRRIFEEETACAVYTGEWFAMMGERDRQGDVPAS